jgi:hypothetical protein
MDRLARRSSESPTVARLIAVAAFASLLGAARLAAAADDAAAAEKATWQQKELRFTYMGFTTHYSCDGLRDEVKEILRQLGARPDMEVREYGCTANFGQPDPFPSVRAKFSVLVPADAKSGSDAVVAARWRTVRLKLGTGALDASGQCELIEQAKQRILPLFVTRNVNFSSDCFPHQVTIRGANLTVDVMEPVPAGPQGTQPQQGSAKS